MSEGVMLMWFILAGLSFIFVVFEMAHRSHGGLRVAAKVGMSVLSVMFLVIGIAVSRLFEAK